MKKNTEIKAWHANIYVVSLLKKCSEKTALKTNCREVGNGKCEVGDLRVVVKKTGCFDSPCSLNMTERGDNISK